MKKADYYVPMINIGGDYCGFQLSKDYPMKDDAKIPPFEDSPCRQDGEWVKREDYDKLWKAFNNE